MNSRDLELFVTLPTRTVALSGRHVYGPYQVWQEAVLIPCIPSVSTLYVSICIRAHVTYIWCM